MDDDSEKSDVDEGVGTSGKTDEANEQMAREPSPELARISALITRPPKQKSSKQRKIKLVRTTDVPTYLLPRLFNVYIFPIPP